MFTNIRSRLSLFIQSKAVNVLLIPTANDCQILAKVMIFKNNSRSKHSYLPQVQFSPKGSKYAPSSPIESAEQHIASTLRNKTVMSCEDWEDFKSDLFEQESVITEENFSSIVMNTLLASNQLDLSRSFLKYAEKCSVKPNFLTYLKYISLCSQNHKVVGQEHILKMISKVKNEIDASPILDNKRAEYIVQGLCATDRWRESLQYAAKLLSGKPTREMCNSLACAAIRNNDENFAWEILNKWMNRYDTLDDKVVNEFLNVALDMQKTNCRESDIFIEKLFHFMQARDIVISMDNAKLIEQYFKIHRIKWTITYSKVKRSGYCETCNYHLKLFNLKDLDFSDLREAFLRRAFMKSDIYINTTVNEFKTYMEFIDVHKPFHIVLDGLNAAYTFRGFISKRNLSKHLMNIVKKLSGKSRKVLVLGRKHMKAWPNIGKISERAKLFFTDNISQDDPFTVFATLASGPHTLFLSGDLMRDHYSRLDDPRLIHLFKRWQLSHQIFLEIDDRNEINFVEPVRHSITINGSMEKGWHIPFDDKIILDPYEELNNWLCIKKCI